MQYEAGFLGAGNMGGALAQVAIRAVGVERVILTCKSAAHTRAAAERLGCAAGSVGQIVQNSRFVFLGIKPQMLDAFAPELKQALAGAACVLVSMLAGVSTARLEALFPGTRVLRILPNTPCAVGEGMTLLCRGSLVSEEDAAALRALLAASGRIDELPEAQIDAAGTVAGCGPAFAYMFAQALADGGVACGLPRAQAAQYAAQMLLGSARMLLESEKHPEQLKDEVCSPGGSTIAGVRALEQAGFRAACMDAVGAAFARTAHLAPGK